MFSAKFWANISTSKVEASLLTNLCRRFPWSPALMTVVFIQLCDYFFFWLKNILIERLLLIKLFVNSMRTAVLFHLPQKHRPAPVYVLYTGLSSWYMKEHLSGPHSTCDPLTKFLCIYASLCDRLSKFLCIPAWKKLLSNYLLLFSYLCVWHIKASIQLSVILRLSKQFKLCSWSFLINEKVARIPGLWMVTVLWEVHIIK